MHFPPLNVDCFQVEHDDEFNGTGYDERERVGQTLPPRILATGVYDVRQLRAGRPGFFFFF